MTTKSATEYKDLGNKALAANNYEEAIRNYSRAIELNSTNAVFYANRAQAHIKSEAYGAAIQDATKAIEIDPTYTKSYYRRAIANSALINPKKALEDLKVVAQRAPNDADARVKLVECQKMVRRQAFEKAIEVEDAPGVRETLDIRDMAVDQSYDGPKLAIDFDERDPTVSMTEQFISQTIERFKNGGLLPKKYLYAIVLHVMKLFEKEASLVDVEVTRDDELITVCGDTHGQFFDLLEIFAKNGLPSETHSYLFNGDFVDRGSWSCEIAIILYCYKILYPNKFFINRGNHETDNMNKVYGFEGECKHKYSSENVFKLFSESFSLLPLATLIGKKLLVLHGGLFSKDGVTLDDIRNIDRFKQKQPGQEGLMMELMWTDPQPAPGRGMSKRGVGIQFGPDITKKFCALNGLDAVIRSHEVRMEGYSEEHDGRLITVFSAPNYCDSQGNLGAYINITKTMKMEFKQFSAVPHPNVKPMAYANQLMF
jgi:serine/threonine-protein phosphatase 5